MGIDPAMTSHRSTPSIRTSATASSQSIVGAPALGHRAPLATHSAVAARRSIRFAPRLALHPHLAWVRLRASYRRLTHPCRKDTVERRVRRRFRFVLPPAS